MGSETTRDYSCGWCGGPLDPSEFAAPTPPADVQAVQVGARHRVMVGVWSVPALKGPRYSIFDIEAGREVFACAMVSQVAGWMNRHAEWYPTDEEMASLLALRARPALPADVQTDFAAADKFAEHVEMAVWSGMPRTEPVAELALAYLKLRGRITPTFGKDTP